VADDDSPCALVIDDEPPIRALLVKLLERRGFQVAAADTGETALAMNHRDRLRVVLCDVRMPGVSGFEIYERLTSETPALASRFVFITGDGASIAADRPELRDVPVLAKPFSASDLDALLTRLSSTR
jgi:two-component system NtrC family sensor kinase